MTSHELARLLLAGPDQPVLLVTNNWDGDDFSLSEIDEVRADVNPGPSSFGDRPHVALVDSLTTLALASWQESYPPPGKGKT